MKFGREITFFCIALLALSLLVLIPAREGKIARLRLERILEMDSQLKEEIKSLCRPPLGTRENTEFEKLFQKHLSPDSETATPATLAKPNCQFTVQAVQNNRFQLRSQWLFHFQLRTADGKRVLNRTYTAITLQPLCLAPLILFIISIFFSPSAKWFWVTISAYLLMLGGGSLIRTVELVLRASALCLTIDQTFLGFALILVWFALYQQRTQSLPVRYERYKWEGSINRISTSIVGIWNPSFYTVLAPLFIPMKVGLRRLIPFLDLQMFIATISLYALTLDQRNFPSLIRESLALPRYFSFALIVFFLMTYALMKPSRSAALSRLPGILPILVSVAGLETVHYFFSVLHPFNTLTRFGVALLLSELIYPVDASVRPVVRSLSKCLSTLFLSVFVAVISQESGVIEMVLVLLDPKIHPSALILFTFLSGISLGFLTGSFSVAFFPLISFALKKSITPSLQEAALMDGVLAGILLSPFSLLNLFTSHYSKINIGDIVRARFKQLAVPLLIGGFIYMVGTLTTIAILQPVTFVFGCLVALTLRLKRNRWTILTT